MASIVKPYLGICAMHKTFITPSRLEPCCSTHQSRTLAVQLGDRVIVDMDGTLSDITFARRWVVADHPFWTEHPEQRPATSSGRFRPNFGSFHAEGVVAPFITHVKKFVRDLQDAGAVLEVVTSREEQWREPTRESLERNGLHATSISMRPLRDYRPNASVKREILQGLVRSGGPIIAALDDRPDIAKTWCDEGIPTYIVAG
jgi:hypothetical protein